MEKKEGVHIQTSTEGCGDYARILEWIERQNIRTSQRDGVSIVAEMTDEQVLKMRGEVTIEKGIQMYRYVRIRKYFL